MIKGIVSKLRKGLLPGIMACLIVAALLVPFMHLTRVAHARHTVVGRGYAANYAAYPAGVKEEQVRAHPVYYRDGVIVLMYHNINPQAKGDGTITPERFKSDLVMLRQKGFNFISAAQLAAFLDRRGDVPPNAILLSFDDGYEGTYQYALPVLREEHAPAVVFIIEGFMGTKQGMLTWQQVELLEKSGLVTIGGHTFAQHYRIPKKDGKSLIPVTVTPIRDQKTGKEETMADYEKRMLTDSLEAQHVLYARLGHTTPYFAYPYGAYTPQLVRILHSAGYRYLFTVIRGVNKRGQDPDHIYRINAGSPWVSPGCLYATIRRVVFESRFPHHIPATWVRS
ncbi:MAG: polysaccharide deacetylase family protein [Thermacetogeniaceae bacterium]